MWPTCDALVSIDLKLRHLGSYAEADERLHVHGRQASRQIGPAGS
jgi:hypothetical protein